MMKMTGRVICCAAALLLALTSVSAVQRLNSIDDLREIDFGGSVPQHSLVLLYWFANTVDIGYDDVIRLTFDPDQGHYGSHHYGNFERLLPWGRYYTVGNLHQDTSRPLPAYVINPPNVNAARNRDRIIIGVNGRVIEQVYITQHYGHQGPEYDPSHTYHITANLLRQIRQFSVGRNNQELQALRNRFGSNANVSHLRNTWGELAGLGLFLVIVMTTTLQYNQQSIRLQDRQSYDSTWNRGSSSFYTPLRQENDLWSTCSELCRSLGYLVALVVFIIFIILVHASSQNRSRY